MSALLNNSKQINPYRQLVLSDVKLLAEDQTVFSINRLSRETI